MNWFRRFASLDKNTTFTYVNSYKINIVKHVPPSKRDGRTKWTKIVIDLDHPYDGELSVKVWADDVLVD